MRQDEVSHTALQVAAARAAHLQFDPPPHLLADVHAQALLGERGRDMIESYGEDAESWILHENRLFLPFRARYAEDRLAEAYGRGTRQLLILGAGLDSYAFRVPENQVGLRIYEVDHPATQSWKQARIEALGWDLPVGLRFVPCDFEVSRPSRALDGTDWSPREPAFVVWLGVTYYLDPETTRGALTDLAGQLAVGSEVVLDYMFPLADLPVRYQELQRQIAEYLGDVGEPQSNRYRDEAIRDVLLGTGYATADIQDREALRARYFAPIRSAIPMSERFGLAVATR